ncbi:MAG: orotate phosphoribosyltransferase [Chloroflexota bacterium]|nr:orotate phosphoribosyltransferase [Chloroflexota bacterium]
MLEIEVQTKGANKLREIAYEVGAVLDGDFTLSSGKKSGRYFEGKKVTLWPAGAVAVGEAVCEILGDVKVDAIGGLAEGASPIVAATAVVSQQKGSPIPSFIVREQTKEHGTQRKVEGHLERGWKVVVIDDVITLGGSTWKAIETVEALGCHVVKVIAIVDRHEGGSDKIKNAGYDFAAFLGFKGDGK